MSEMEVTIPIPHSNYNECIIIEKYGDQYSLVSGVLSQKADGTVFKKWGFPQDKDKKPREKAIPWKITLGNRNDAIEIIKSIALEFGLQLAKDDIGF